jgi:hypothetical protein
MMIIGAHCFPLLQHSLLIVASGTTVGDDCENLSLFSTLLALFQGFRDTTSIHMPSLTIYKGFFLCLFILVGRQGCTRLRPFRVGRPRSLPVDALPHNAAYWQGGRFDRRPHFALTTSAEIKGFFKIIVAPTIKVVPSHSGLSVLPLSSSCQLF